MVKSGSFKCPKCQRTFSMAAHLGRHTATMHGKKAAPAPVKRTAIPRRPASPPDRTGRLLSEIRAARNELDAQQAQLAIQIAALYQLLLTLGGAACRTDHRTAPLAARGGARKSAGGARDGSLRFYIEKVLQGAGKPMRVADITTAVQRAGFKTKNKTLATTVGITLATMPTAKRVERGVFVGK